MLMETKIRTHSQIIKREMQLRLTQENTLVLFFIAALAYCLISIIVSNCCPIECVSLLANIGNAVDDLFRNICYGIIAGVIFYFINDIYRNVIMRVSDMDSMFGELLLLYSNACNMLQTISNNTYNNCMDLKQGYKCIMKNLCNEDVEFRYFGNPYISHIIKVDDCALLVNKWKDANKVRYDFLCAYGELLERQEIYRLNGFDDSLVSDIVSFLSRRIEEADGEIIQISDYDITVIVNRTINYKKYLTYLAKKYVKYNYRKHYLNRLCEEKDFE